MEKEFVPFELAVKLKTLGFDEPCLGYLDCDRHFIFNEVKSNFLDCEIKIPTFSQAFRWFRDKYNIFPEIVTDCNTEPKFCYTYTRFFGNQNDLSSKEWGWENNIGQYSLLYRTYEEAELACLEKLIEIVG